MDSVTQIALGAAVGHAVGGRQFGRRALLWGAVLGTLPDLDVLVPLGDAVRDFTYHRSASHSLLVLAAVTPVVVWLVRKVYPDTEAQWRRWASLTYLVFATHVLLDSFTVYGTQIFWPLYTAPMTWSTIFIIDPAYTLPLLVGLAAALWAGRRSYGIHWNAVGLGLSTLYLAWSLAAKLHLEGVARDALAVQGVQADAILTVPTPFNTVLWRILAVNRERYYEGFYSMLDGDHSVTLRSYPRYLDLLVPLEHTWPVERLAAFTKGFFAASGQGAEVVISDLRMGIEPDYVFRFRVGNVVAGKPTPAPVERRPTQRNFDRLPWVWQRIWDSTAIETGRPIE